MLQRVVRHVLTAALITAVGGCDDGATTQADTAADTSASDLAADGAADGTADGAADGAVDATDATATDAPEDMVSFPIEPVPARVDEAATAESMSRGFQLYYRERVDRVLTSYNRFQLFGGSTFGTNIGRAWIARTGQTFEIVPGPKDNNRIGTSAWMAYNAYREIDSRALELTLIRIFNGIAFLEATSGHPGMTAREVYPGWTRRMDGPGGAVTLTRLGQPITPPQDLSSALEGEILATFFSDVDITYRENPEEFLFSFTPAAEIDDYAISHSFVELPNYLRVTDCCSSLMKTPATEVWGGAFWGNHNSRDNFPDLVLGLLAARGVLADGSAPPELVEAAQRAVDAGQRIGDLVVDNGMKIMTVDEHGTYQDLIVSGDVRPDGEDEREDLGSLGACGMAYLAQAVSTAGLQSPVPTVPLPGSLDYYFADLSFAIDCDVPDGEPTCSSVGDAYCSTTWDRFGWEVQLLGEPLIEVLENPDTGPLIGGFQNDFDDVSEAMLGVYHYAQISGNDALADEARSSLFYLTELQKDMADAAFSDNAPKLAAARRQAALYQAQASLPAEFVDFEDFAYFESQMANLEARLNMADTTPWPLVDDAEIATRIEDELSEGRTAVVDRYRAEYGMSPPLRRTATGYEARATPLADYPWTEVEVPRHDVLGSVRLMHAITLCDRAPHLVDCTWAALGCARPDLDDSGGVDGADQALFDTAVVTYAAGTCDAGNSFCDGADLDQDGILGELDTAFMNAALGCVR